MSTEADQLKAAKIVAHIHHEMGLHIEYCKGFGIDKEDMEKTEESQGILLNSPKVLKLAHNP